LLSTKLFLPPLRGAIVARPRLTHLLNECLTRSLTVICAPAGFGKTTLLSEWRAFDHTAPLAWVSLDEADSDPMRFWQYVIAALNRLHAGVGDTALTMMRSPQPPPLEATLTVLINDLAALSTDFYLVLDDYHTIAAQPVHEGLAFLLDHLPAPMHVIILSRADPPLPLSRLRARRQLLEIRANDLRCTPEEAAAFLNQVMQLNLAEADISALTERTEGWMAGLQLAALSLHGRADAAAFITSFKGDDRYVLDYLVEEVLLQQPASVQEFLLNTSLLERMTAALCTTVTGRADAQAMLEQLEHSNLFIVPLDNTRKWYRYHHLFADLLRHRLQQVHPERVFDLHRRAAQWFEQNQLMDEAITHTLAAQDFDRAAHLIGQMVRPLYFVRSEPRTLLNWIDALPPEIASAYPQVGIGQAWCLLTFGQLDQATARCNSIMATLGDTPSDRVWRGEVETVLGVICMLRADIPQLAHHAERALQWLPPEDVLSLGIVQWERGQVYRFAGEPAAAAQAFGEAARFSREAGNLFFELLALSNRADRLLEQGYLREGIATHRQVQTVATQGGRRPLPIIGDSYAWTAITEWERNELDAAQADVVRGVELSLASGIPEIILTTLVVQARVLSAREQFDQAQAVLDQALTRAQHYNVPHILEHVQAAMAQEQLHRNNLIEAWRWAQQSPIHAALIAPIDYGRDEDYLVYAEICLRQGCASNDRALLEQTVDLLQRSIKAASEKGRQRQVVRAQILLALTQTALGRNAEAHKVLEQALRLGEPEGFLRSFVMHGETMRTMLVECRTRLDKQRAEPRLLEYLDRLGAAFPQSVPAPSKLQPSVPHPRTLIEPLSDRELEVLRLIAVDRSNQDIASELYLSVNTVKTHIQHIYEKLNVSSRLSAVEEARRLKIL
jgi:LuxR family maltose regulon positive regulatory protein